MIQVVGEKPKSLQHDTNPPPSSSKHNSPGSTPAKPVEANSPPSIVRKVKIDPAIRIAAFDPASTPTDRSQQQEAGTVLDPLIRKFPYSKEGDLSDAPLIRKYKVAAKPWKTAAERWDGKPPAVFSRPRIVHLQRLPPGTKTGDIIQAMANAAEEGKLSQRADRIADIRVIPRFGDDKFLAARIEFLHPDSARTVDTLVRQGHLQIRGENPVSSLIQSTAMPKLYSEFGLGATSDEDRRANFSRPDRARIVRRTPLIYN